MKRLSISPIPTSFLLLFGLCVSSSMAEELTSAKAVAMSGAVVAQADETMALRWNPAGLAGADDRRIAIGLEFGVRTRADFYGFDPNPGRGVRAEQPTAPPPGLSIDWVEPVARRWAIGAGLRRRQIFEQDWTASDASAVAPVARHSRLDGYRLDLAAAVVIHPKLSLGIGPIIDQLRLDWARDEQLFYPASGNLEDVGFSRLRSRSKTTVGISAGLLADGIGRWSLGLRWTRPGEMRFRGGGQYVQQPTGDPALDQFAASRLPFGQTAPWRADWMSAEEWVVGAAYQIKPTMVLELDLERRRRRRARQLQIEFLGAPTLDRTPLQRWDETTAARVGLRWSGLGNGEWRAGASYEPSPQPSDDADPFLALGDRVAASIGFGTRVRRVQADVALRAERRHTLRIRDSVDGFTGRYRNRRIRVVVTFAW